MSKVSQRADLKASYQSFWRLFNTIEAVRVENSESGSNLIIFPIDLHFCSLIKLGGSLSSYHWYVSNPPQCLVLLYIWCFRGLLHWPDTLLTCLLSTQCIKDRNIKKSFNFMRSLWPLSCNINLSSKCMFLLLYMNCDSGNLHIGCHGSSFRWWTHKSACRREISVRWSHNEIL